MLRSRRRHAADNEAEQQEQLVNERGDPPRTPAALDEEGKAPDGALEDGRRVGVLLPEDVGEGEEDVVGELAVQRGGRRGGEDGEELIEEV